MKENEDEIGGEDKVEGKGWGGSVSRRTCLRGEEKSCKLDGGESGFMEIRGQ